MYYAVCSAGSVVEHMGSHAMATQLFLCRRQLPCGAIPVSHLEEKSLVAIRPLEGNVHKLAENIQLLVLVGELSGLGVAVLLQPLST